MIALSVGDLEKDGRTVMTNADAIQALFEAARAVFDTADGMHRGSWLVPNATMKALVQAIEAIDPTWEKL